MSAYATKDELREWLKIPRGDTSPDTLIDLAIAAASDSINEYTGRNFDETSTSEARIFDGGCPVFIDDAQTVTLVEQSSDRTTWTTVTGTWLEPDNTIPKTKLRTTSPFARWVRATGTWGYGSVPDRVKMATLIKAARLYERRKSTTGVIGVTDFGEVRISRQSDPDVADLLDPLRRADRAMGFGVA